MTRICAAEGCTEPLTGRGHRRFHSNACKMRTHRTRAKSMADIVGVATRIGEDAFRAKMAADEDFAKTVRVVAEASYPVPVDEVIHLPKRPGVRRPEDDPFTGSARVITSEGSDLLTPDYEDDMPIGEEDLAFSVTDVRHLSTPPESDIEALLKIGKPYDWTPMVKAAAKQMRDGLADEMIYDYRPDLSEYPGVERWFYRLR